MIYSWTARPRLLLAISENFWSPCRHKHKHALCQVYGCSSDHKRRHWRSRLLARWMSDKVESTCWTFYLWTTQSAALVYTDPRRSEVRSTLSLSIHEADCAPLEAPLHHHSTDSPPDTHHLETHSIPHSRAHDHETWTTPPCSVGCVCVPR